MLFTSPTTTGGHNYPVINFEADLPAIENTCNTVTGAGCVNPPPGSQFYPFYSTRADGASCSWQEGGPFIPGTVNDFGGSSAEFGSLLLDHVPGGRVHDGPAVRELQQRQPGQRLPCGLAKAKVRSDEGSGSAPLPSASKIPPQCC